jgi:hypothetical protein
VIRRNSLPGSGTHAGAAAICLAFIVLSLAPSSASAEFGIVPGSTVAKTHPVFPLLHIPGQDPPNQREINLPAILAAAPIAQAGAHPDASGGGVLTDTFNFKVKDFYTDSPPGFIGNPTVVPACDRESFDKYVSGEDPEEQCAPASQVGVATIKLAAGPKATHPVYRLTPSSGSPASFGFEVARVPIIINANVRTDEDYGLRIAATDIDAGVSAGLQSAIVTLWGVPAASIHDPDRWDPTKGEISKSGDGFPTGDWGAQSGLARVPFLQTPADCNAAGLLGTARLRSWQEQDRLLPDALTPNPQDYEIPAPQPTGCEKLSFKPSITLVPSATNSDSPTGVSVQMEVPQNYDPEGLSTPQLRKAVVTLPEGMSVNPSAADGIEGCTTAQMGLLTTNGAYPNPIRFAKGDADCPQASKVGAGIVNTKLLEEPLEGDVYLATPYDNPFKSLLALYLVFRGPGFVVKLPGKVEPDPVTGQLTATFDYNPQLPFDKLSLNFFGGPRAPLATSPLCGEQQITTDLEPWSRPYTPDAFPENHYEATKGPAGTPCSNTLASRPFAPELTAGTASPIAGAYAGMTMRLTRPDGHQPLAGLTVKPPLGFTARLAGVPYCSDQAIALAPTRSGEYEAAHPDCPTASLVGHALVGAGAGPTPLYTPGNAYLAGPYKGAPLSLVVITPALAGGAPGHPVFDLGTVVVRVALHVDPVTAQVTAVSDPVPQTLQGIPLRIRDIRFALDRKEFGLNPTSCADKSFDVEASGQNGATASLSNRFQVLECGALAFKPSLALRLKGATKRNDNPALRATLTYPPASGYANIKSAQVTLPHSAFLDQSHIRTVCTRVQFAAKQCPADSVYGRASAITPLLDQPLAGPVYLRSSSNLLPDLVAVLRGPESQPIEVVLDGRVDSKHGGIRTTFEAVPDAPVSKFTLEMQGGRKGLIVNSRDLCKAPSYATARFGAHNGRIYTAHPQVVASGCAKKASKRHRGHRARPAARGALPGWARKVF